MTVEVRRRAAAHKADVAQAAYFKELLLDARTQFDSELDALRVRLRELVDGDVVVGLRSMARARRAVRESEALRNETDRLIAALDQRFCAL